MENQKIFCSNCAHPIAIHGNEEKIFCPECGQLILMQPQSNENGVLSETVADVAANGIESALDTQNNAPPANENADSAVAGVAVGAAASTLFPSDANATPQQMYPQNASDSNYAPPAYSAPYAAQGATTGAAKAAGSAGGFFSSTLGIALISLVGLAAVIVIFISLILPLFTGTKNQPSGIGVVDNSSSIVSQGVQAGDLGNIPNGQFAILHNNQLFYTAIEDDTYASHIYKADKSGGNATPITDGFIYSLAAKGDALYFAGTENNDSGSRQKLHIYSMALDGSNKKQLTADYAYNLNVYQDYLYYQKFTPANSMGEKVVTLGVYRMKLDGTGEELIVEGSCYCLVLYQNKFYYVKDNTIYQTTPDGKQTKVIDQGTSFFVIGNGKIYTYSSDTIMEIGTDGSGKKNVYKAGAPISTINVYKDVIYYSMVDEKLYDSNTSTYGYAIHKINADGKNDKKIYEGYSYGIYMNLLDDKLFIFKNYYNSSNSNVDLFSTDLNGGNIKQYTE